ncbi:MAG: hypothetical protein H0V39_01465 [Nitrosomonas sp.]|nr:hypothetical protein [Nitrosomonas sp.]
MSWQDNERYKKERKELAELHESLTKQGINDPLSQIYDLVFLEMSYASGDIDFTSTIASLVYNWKKEGHSYYIDKAQLLCYERGLIPPPTVMQSIIEETNKRLKSKKSAAVRIEKGNHKFRTLLLMANLIFYGDTLEEASSKAAQWMKDILKITPIKASTLEKYYLEEFRNNGYEAKYHRNWNKWIEPDVRLEWERINNILPTASEGLKGSRR